MKHTRALGAVFCLALGLAAASPAVAQDRVDLVVLLDSSRSMFPYYDQVVDYVLSGALKEYMRSGDAFHLISFSDSTQVELSQVLRTEEDLKAVLARLYLLYPLGENTDLVNALRNAYQYVSDLPDSGFKHILLITDGMHSPSAASPWAALDAAGVQAELQSSAGRIRERGWTMSIVRVPFDRESAAGGNGAEAAGAAGSGDYLDTVAGALGVEATTFDPADASGSLDSSITLPRIEFPASLGKRDYAFSLPFTLENRSDSDITLELTGIFLPDGQDVLKKRLFLELAAGKKATATARILLPDSLPQGEQSISLEPRFADGLRVSPARSDISLTIKKAPVAAFFRNTARAIVFLALVALVLILVFMVARYVRAVHKRSEQPIVDAVIDSQAVRYQADRRDAAALLAGAAGTGARSAADYRPDSRDAAALLAGAAGIGSRTAAASAAASGASAYSARAGRASLEARKPDSRDAAALLSQAARKAQPAVAQPVSEAGTLAADGRAALLSAWKSSERPQRRLGATETAPAAPVLKYDGAPAIAYQSRLRRPGAARFVLDVLGQNPNVGKRNIKTMHAGGKRSLGGGSSDFLVFLLPIPRRVADVHYDGENITVVPVRRSYFPYAEGPLEDCLGRDIALHLPDGKILTMRISRYTPPVEQINKLLHCIDSPGAGVDAMSAAEE